MKSTSEKRALDPPDLVSEFAQTAPKDVRVLAWRPALLGGLRFVALLSPWGGSPPDWKPPPALRGAARGGGGGRAAARQPPGRRRAEHRHDDRS